MSQKLVDRDRHSLNRDLTLADLAAFAFSPSAFAARVFANTAKFLAQFVGMR
jgi:hypothetical protein